ncbi:MAG TPA: hypothetical protein PLD79_03570 [Halothiobacillus sp.]|jgi:predicted RNA-binding Zn-ribbon protein involved in translation (DUF1610 family)|nr:hypothetical protein [Halothiobacillus sp.]HQT43051.1 hypothetical protein [Halothiobacillus sp.]
MASFCPECGSNRVQWVHQGKKTEHPLAPLAGAAIGSSGLFGGSSVGTTLGAAGGPAGMLAFGIAGAIIGGLLAGCNANQQGSAARASYQCADCGHTFSG